MTSAVKKEIAIVVFIVIILGTQMRISVLLNLGATDYLPIVGVVVINEDSCVTRIIEFVNDLREVITLVLK